MGRYLGSIPRRSLLACAGGLGLLGSVFSNIQTVSAQTMTGPPPEVDRLAVRVVTDSYQHLLVASGKFGDVSVQRFAGSASQNLPLPRMLVERVGLVASS